VLTDHHRRGVRVPSGDGRVTEAYATRSPGEFARRSPDSPGFACLPTMRLAGETIGFD
jgi:hypothetical protein